MSGPYYIAVYGGFLVEQTYEAEGKRIQKLYTVPNVRLATTWPDFVQADAFAKYAVAKLYPPDLRYFALLRVAHD